ncbi:hypothetical protein E4P39_09080 [Blastococcus sp. CT_GayMR19]|uniref:cell division protein PerM n=1 Tax=Blastococcus sp. CT_GayMR19 TaxID=2559608 RepID=UPI0010733D8E|nr:DUF6350 family protein [Blastococcus sp. CT_GayMR19]TFV76036.1 hypothetical protein E4P39_09080 [Blastococcus sp. CT_GayMR19]
MVSLLARLPRRGRDGGGPGALSLGWLAIAAILAVDIAGLAGLGLAIVVVQTLDPAGGLPFGGSTALAGQLWLLAQGGELELGSGPLVLAPLLLTLGIAWGLSRAGRGVARAHEITGGAAAARAVGLLVGAHLLVSLLLVAVLDATTGGIGLLRTAAGVTVLALASVGWGVARESGLLDALLDRLPGAARPLLRGVLAGLLAALALCTAVVAVALVSDAQGYAALSGSLGGAAAGAAGLLGLGLLLLPNASAAVLGLAAGPGFHVGTGTLVSVHGVTLGAVPALPLLAALPDTQAVPLIAFVSQAVPALAGLVAGITVGRWFTGGGSVLAALTGILAGVLLGVVSGALVWVAGGSLGDGALAQVGAPAVATGIAVAAQSGLAAALAAAVARWRALG